MKKHNSQAAETQVVSAADVATIPAEVAAPKKERKAASTTSKVEFFTPMIEEGKFTAKELLEAALASGQFPKLTESTIRTFITDSKNPRYNKFPKLVVKGENGKLSFQKEEAQKEA